MKTSRTFLSLLLVVSFVVPTILASLSAYAPQSQALTLSDVWAVEMLDDEVYTVHIAMEDPDALIPSGPLGPEHATSVQSIWVTKQDGTRPGSLELERQIVVQAQNRKLLIDNPNWVSLGQISADDIGLEQYQTDSEGYIFSMYYPADLVNSEYCMDIFNHAWYMIFFAGGMTNHVHRRDLYKEMVERLVFQELTFESYDELLAHFMGRYGEIYERGYAEIVGAGGDFAELSSWIANSIEADLFLSGNIEALQAHGAGLETFRDDMRILGEVLQTAAFAERVMKDAYEGLMMHAYSNGLAAERMAAIMNFAQNAEGLDYAFVQAVEAMDSDFREIVDSKWRAALNRLVENTPGYLLSWVDSKLGMQMAGWGYFGVGLKLLMMTFEYLYGRDDVYRTLALDITLQKDIQEYILAHSETAPLRELLLLNNMQHYLSYHFYADPLYRPDIYLDAVCWDPGMSFSDYMNYLETQRDSRESFYRAYGPPDFLASDEARWFPGKIDTPSIHAITPGGPLTVTKPDPVSFVVSVSDDDEIAHVGFRSGNYSLGAATYDGSNWMLNWDTIPFPGGQHLIQITAEDIHGLKGEATVVVDLVDPGFARDFSAYDLSASPADPQIGDPVGFSATVKNLGIYPETSAPVSLYIDEQLIGTQYVSLDPADTAAVNYAWSATEGAHNVRLQVELPYDENPGNDFDTLILGSLEPGVLQVAGSQTPETIHINLEPGTTTDRSVVLRNNGDVGLNISVSGVPPSNGTLVLLDSTPFYLGPNSTHIFDFRVGLNGSAPVGQEFPASITFASPGGDVFQSLTVEGVEVLSGVETSVAMDSGWVDDGSGWYYDTVDLTPWQDLIADGLDYARLRFVADAVDTCPTGHCDYLVSVLDGFWSHCGSGNSGFYVDEIPIERNWTFCDANIMGHSSREIYIEALGEDRFHIDQVEFLFKAYDGDPNLELSRQISPATIYINQTATIELNLLNVGSNIANEPYYDESSLPYNLSLVSGDLVGETSDVDPGEIETATYVVQALQPGEYTLASSTVLYYNPSSSHAYLSSFGNDVLTVLGGTLVPSVSFDPEPHYYGQPRMIHTQVTDSLNGQIVSGADVRATVTTPDSQTYDVQLRYEAGLDEYVGMFHATYQLGTYSVHVTASQDYYTDGATSPDETFTVVTPYGLDLASSGEAAHVLPYITSHLAFSLDNSGAVGDTAALEVTDLPLDWQWGVTPGIATLASGQSIDGAVVVKPAPGSPDSTYPITLQAASLGDADVTDTEIMDVVLDGTPPALESPLTINPITVTPGEWLTMTIDLDESAILGVTFESLDSMWDPDALEVLEIDPAEHVYLATYPLSAGTEMSDGHYKLGLQATDAAGNVLSASSEDVWLERHSPAIVATAPADGEQVPFGTQVTVHFSEPMAQEVTAAAFGISPVITGTWTWADEQSLVFAPNIYFEPGQTYTVSVESGATDVAGNLLPPASWSFNVLSPEQSVDLPLQVGWNLLSLAFEGATGLDTAEDLCIALGDAGVDPVEVDRWQAAGWDSHVCGLPFNDFELASGRGYFALLQQAGTWAASGLPLQTSLAIPLQVGWNLVSIPVDIYHTAESAGQEIIAQGGQCEEIYRWYAGGWDSHIIGLPFNDFEMVPGSGYFILCSASSTWTLVP